MGLPRLVSDVKGRTAVVYALVDPASHEPFYVGVTTRGLGRRLCSHIHDARFAPSGDAKRGRIASILAANMRPCVYELEAQPVENWIEAEQFWIGYLRYLGADLTNRSAGGAGKTGYTTPISTRNLQSDAAKAHGKWRDQLHTPAARAKTGERLRGRPGRQWNQAEREAQAARITGKKLGPASEERKRKVSAAVKGPRNGMWSKTGAAAPMSRSICVNGLEYASIKAAAQALGRHRRTVLALASKQGQSA